MPIVCTRCGNVLSRDDSRFCNNCGAPLLAEPPSSAGSAPPDQTDSNSEGEKSHVPQKPVLREQIAQQPGAQAVRRTTPQGPPSWMQELDRPEHNNRRRMAPRLVRPEPPQKVSPRPEVPPEPEPLPEQHGFPPSMPRSGSDRPTRELRVKIWNQDTVQASTVQAEAESAPIPQEPELSIEQVPTSPLSSTPVADVASSQEEEEYEELPTGPLPLSPRPVEQVPPWRAPTTPRVQSEPERAGAVPPWQMLPDERARVEEPGPEPVPTGFPPSSPVDAPIAVREASPRMRRGPLLVLLVLVLVALLSAGGVWLWLAQPFSVPAITQPYQTLSNGTLGLMLRYPNDWSVQRKSNPTGVLLSDTTQTAQVVLTVTSAGGGQINMQQQAAKAGLTNLTPGAVAAHIAFGGVTWQQTQGTLLQSGATYTGTLLVTIYKQRLYSIVFLAPQGIYAQEEKVNFAPIRASFQFLS